MEVDEHLVGLLRFKIYQKESIIDKTKQTRMFCRNFSQFVWQFLKLSKHLPELAVSVETHI